MTSIEGIKHKILIIGATGNLGRYITEASVKLAHLTFALVRKATVVANPTKAQLVQSFKNSGVQGDLNDYESLVNSIKKVDIVFSMMGHEPEDLAGQMNIISAIKEAGNIKRYLPSEYGMDVERVQVQEPALEPARRMMEVKASIRQAIRDAGIPFTFVSSNFYATYFLFRIGQVEATGPPEENVFIVGKGNTSVIYVAEQDIATYSIKAADDPRTLNKILYIRPHANIYSLNELVTLWEKKIDRILKRIYISEEEVLQKIKDLPAPLPFFYAIAYASFVKGEKTNFEIDPDVGVEACELFPSVKYTTVDEWLTEFHRSAKPNMF